MVGMEITDLILVVMLLPIGFFIFIIWFFVAFQKKKNELLMASKAKDLTIEEKEKTIFLQAAVQKERNRIATEMHDELGSSLTVIKYLSESAALQTKEEKIRNEINKISNYSAVVIKSLSEIIWAMNSRYDNLNDMVAHLRTFSSKFLSDQNIQFSFNYVSSEDNPYVSAEKRRNILLAIKEILNNAAKYSGANFIAIDVVHNGALSIIIVEQGGKTFDPASSLSKGNGINNIYDRVGAIGGHVTYLNTDHGMKVIMSIPLQSS
jgi:signal transduction histidine kinase